MLPSNQGAIRLFRFAGIDVFLHWSWFVVALYEIQGGWGRYRSPFWNAAEYLALFVLVLLHEFGHSLACRQVGGTANRIVLWPLGGVAYVDPPQRPGATLWSIAAGPLVNVVLLPILSGAWILGEVLSLGAIVPSAYALVQAVWAINLGLLVFNVLPIYPLDGGQILRSLLWFVMGRAQSLITASLVGFLGVAGLAVLALLWASPWLGILAVFVALNCWTGFQHARVLLRIARLPRHAGLVCPSCESAPPIGAFWVCGTCRKPFDIFEEHGVCPYCRSEFASTRCVDCGRLQPMDAWGSPSAALLVRP